MLFLLPIFMLAQEFNFTASVDRTQVGLGEPFTLEVQVSGENIGSIPKPELPGLPDFDVQGSSQSQSTNISFINGKMTRQSTINFIYRLAPKKIGKSVIGPCLLKMKDKTYETQPVEIEVVKAGSAPGPGTNPAGGPTPGAAPSPDDNLMIVASSTRSTVFMGEQVNVEYGLYTRYNIQDIGNAQMPTFSGFWTEKIFEPNRIDFQRKAVNGKTYDAAVLKKMALFPMTSGELKIDPMALSVAVVQPPQDFFDVFGTTRTIRVESKPIVIKSTPLPEPRPAEFSGGVGRFTITASLDRDTSAASEPINIIVRISGRGNIRLIEKPAIPGIEGLRILDPEIKDEIKLNADAVEGYKEFRFPVIPQTDGNYIIPGLAVAYFDPQQRSYETIRTGELRFTAVKTSAAGQVSDASGLKVLGTDINYIKPDADRLAGRGYGAPAWLAVVYPLSLCLVAGSFFYRKRRERLSRDVSYARLSRSKQALRKMLKQAETRLKENRPHEFYCSLTQAVTGYIGDTFNLEAQTMTRAEIRDELLKRGISKETVDRVIGIIDQCDQARFSPQTKTFKDPQALLKKVKETLTRL